MTPIKDKLYANALERKNHEEKRTYLGFSEIGNECSRYLWLKFHHPELQEPFSEHRAIIFENGHWVEKKLIHQMRQSGFEITDQQSFITMFNGQFGGHCEGILHNHPEYGKIVFEIKGIQNSDWKKYEKYGVKATNPVYFIQCIMYAGVHSLPGCVIIIENKDNQKIYEEYIPFDVEICNETIQKAANIIYKQIPKGISSRSDWWKCVHCQFNHENACRKNWEGESPF